MFKKRIALASAELTAMPPTHQEIDRRYNKHCFYSGYGISTLTFNGKVTDSRGNFQRS